VVDVKKDETLTGPRGNAFVPRVWEGLRSQVVMGKPHGKSKQSDRLVNFDGNEINFLDGRWPLYYQGVRWNGLEAD
jgi:hypothetical protein